MSDILTVALVSGGVSLGVAIIGFIASWLSHKDDRQDKSRDTLVARLDTEQKKAEDATNRLYEALEANRQALNKADGDCNEKVLKQQARIDALEVKMDSLWEFINAYMRAVRNNVSADVVIKIRDDLDGSGIEWPKRS